MRGEFARVIQRNIESYLPRVLADTPVMLLNGARQTGKTTLARALAEQSKGHFFTLDDATTLGLVSGDPVGFIRHLSGLVVIDEIQKAPALFPAIKLAVDRNRVPGRFVLTGSANVLTLPHLSESLAGRIEIVPLFPLSIGELYGVTESFISRLFQGPWEYSPLAPSEHPTKLVVRGGYPEAAQRISKDRRAAWFASYISTILQRDVMDLARVESLTALPNLLKILAARTSGLLNLSDVARDAALPHSTLTRYLALLETVFLVHRLPAWSPNLGKRLVKAPKIHLIDSGLAAHLVGAHETRLNEDRTLFGRLLETFVVGELRKQVSWTDPSVSLYHFRTSAGSEVDIVLEQPDGSMVGIEVKAGATVSAHDFTALRTLRDEVGPSFKNGIILYLGDQVIPFGDRLWVLPLPTLWGGQPQRP